MERERADGDEDENVMESGCAMLVVYAAKWAELCCMRWLESFSSLHWKVCVSDKEKSLARSIEFVKMNFLWNNFLISVEKRKTNF